MLKIIMREFVATNNLKQLKESLDRFLQGDSASEPNKIYLKKVASEYFYNKQYQKMIEAINKLASVTTEKET